VVVFDARISDEADRKAIEHLIDNFEVDCGRVTSEALATPSESPSPSPSPTTYAAPSATPSPSPNPSPNRDYNAPEPSAGVPHHRLTETMTVQTSPTLRLNRSSPQTRPTRTT
jgi:hypothetical protein